MKDVHYKRELQIEATGFFRTKSPYTLIAVLAAMPVLPSPSTLATVYQVDSVVSSVSNNGTSPATPRPETTPTAKVNTDTLDAGWRQLWDGATTRGWRSARDSSFPKTGWQIKDGVLSVLKSNGGENGQGGDIITVEKFSDFELSLDFKLSPGANSGIKYFVDPEINKGEGSAIGLEYQLLDDALHPDAKLGKDGNRTVAALYDLYPAVKTKKPNAIGEWNTARIVSRGAHVEHWLNGEKVLEYTRFTPQFRTDVQSSKYKVWPRFGELREGHILLQDHGDEVSFRNIKIRVIPSEF